MKVRHNRKRGVVLIWVTLTIMVLVALVGLVVDTGYALFAQQRLQVAADASALAGAQFVRRDVEDARARAAGIALSNRAANKEVVLNLNSENDVDGDIVVGHFQRATEDEEAVFTPGYDNMNAVKVVARRTQDHVNGAVPLTFGRIVGVSEVNVQSSAIAMIGGGTGGGLIALNCDPEVDAIYVEGSPILDVQGGAVISNGQIQIGGSAVVDAPAGFWSMGGMHSPGNSEADITGEHHYLEDCVSDPLAFLQDVTPYYGEDLGMIDTSGAQADFPPGYYSEGLRIGAGDDVTLDPGIYILGGEGLQLRGQSNLHAEGVMFYIVDGGSLYLGGNATVHMTPLQDGSSPFNGVTVYQTTDAQATMIGTSGNTIEGTLYFPHAELELSGEGDGFGNQVIANKFHISGTGTKTIAYEGDEEAVGNRIFIVR
ncbi:MAG: TadG family pilus assembly protein [Phycisphaeraceae bacterium]